MQAENWRPADLPMENTTLNIKLILTLMALLSSAAWSAEEEQPLPISTPALQVALDRHGFSVGLIDGNNGSKTEVALADFKEAMAITNEIILRSKLDIDKIPAFKNYAISQVDLDQVGSAPLDWVAASRVDHMACESLIEVISEKFHVSEIYLRTINPEISDWNSTNVVGKTIKVPNVILRESSKTAAKLSVDCRQFRIRALDSEGRIMASFPCSVAMEGRTIPDGALKVTVCANNPTYTFDPKNYLESARAQEIGKRLLIPSGPNNPVGLFWISLNKPSFGIHGTPHPETIGCRESHGCFRLANWDVVRLGRLIASGTPVEVTGLGKPKASKTVAPEPLTPVQSE